MDLLRRRWVIIPSSNDPYKNLFKVEERAFSRVLRHLSSSGVCVIDNHRPSPTTYLRRYPLLRPQPNNASMPPASSSRQVSSMFKVNPNLIFLLTAVPRARLLKV